MTALTKYQTIEYNGQPTFVLVPWKHFNRLRPLRESQDALATGIPQEVVETHVQDGTPMIRAWREHLGITQAELAQRKNITQAAIAKFEKPGARPCRATLIQIAAALGITTPAQLAG
jgi:ribosome-binding protein aMBF1 (putative translation factor)